MVEGPMGRDVRDTLLLLTVLASDDPRDPLAGHLDRNLAADLAPADLSTLKVAFTPDLGGFAPIDAGLRDLFDKHTTNIAKHFRSTAIASPDFADADFVYETLRAVAFVGTWHQRMREMPGKWGRNVTRNYQDGLKLTVEQIAQANLRWTEIYRSAVSFFDDFDLLITPTCAVSPWPKHEIYPKRVAGRETANYFDWVRMTYGITLLNHPSISIPCGLDASGLPFGLQLVAPRGKDAFLFQAAMALEAVLEPRPVPDLRRLAAMPPENPLERPVQ
jgi:Asp-tRNA(Asn)/Glu-tRNA(Gln) amidotransferase A subunit family amidase